MVPKGVPKGCQFNIPQGLIGTPWKVLVYICIYLYLYIHVYTIFASFFASLKVAWRFLKHVLPVSFDIQVPC